MKKLIVIISLLFTTGFCTSVQDALKINDQAKEIQVLKKDVKEETDAKNWEGTQKNISLFFNGVLALAWLIK